MGLPSIENFDISFIERTLENLTRYTGKYEFTMLLNSLLGLLIVPKEQQVRRYIKYNYFNKKIKNVEVLKSILSKGSERLRKGNKEIEQKKFYWLSDSDNEISFNEIKISELLTRMRNSVAHFGIVPLAHPENNTEWHGVILQNYRQRDDRKNFEIYLNESEMEIISKFIAQTYIDNVKSPTKKEIGN